MTKEIKLDYGRIEGIRKDLKRLKTLEGLRRFLTTELLFTEDTIISHGGELK